MFCTEVDALKLANPATYLYCCLRLVCPRCRGCALLIRIEAKKLDAMLVVCFHQTDLICLTEEAQWILEWDFSVNYLALECLMITHEISIEICLTRKKKS